MLPLCCCPVATGSLQSLTGAPKNSVYPMCTESVGPLVSIGLPGPESHLSHPAKGLQQGKSYHSAENDRLMGGSKTATIFWLIYG